uniref:Uncharacterized protein n=1 Tax=Nyssomyia neivai TaxID=330878 RepID=A0A1L8D8P5_9DIPT
MVSLGLRKDFKEFSSCFLCASSSGLAVITSQTTSPRWAAMIVLKALITPSRRFRRPFSAISSNKLDVASANRACDAVCLSAAAKSRRCAMGLAMASLTLGFPRTADWS